MCDRIKAAVDARTDPASSSWARTDAAGVGSLDGASSVPAPNVEAGADMIFPEPITSLRCTKSSPPREGADLANITGSARRRSSQSMRLRSAMSPSSSTRDRHSEP